MSCCVFNPHYLPGTTVHRMRTSFIAATEMGFVDIVWMLYFVCSAEP